jgi:hypothetical protein
MAGSTLPRPWHRVRQFFGALRPRVTVRDRVEGYVWLTPPQQRLFETMTIRDQQHGIAVMRRVRAEAGDDPTLLAAALLHDCGKGKVALWHRVAYVLLGAWPALRDRVAARHGAAWRQAIWRLAHHPSLGAGLVAHTGADPEIVRMIRQQDAPAQEDRRLAILQSADNA